MFRIRIQSWRGLTQFWIFFNYWSHNFEIWHIYVRKTQFWDTFVFDFFYLEHRKRVIRRKCNFWTNFESIISPTILKLEQGFFFTSVQNLAILCLFFFVLNFFNVYIYFQKFPYISQNIPELKNAIHNICRVRDSERNKENLIVIASVGLPGPFGKKKFSVEANYQRKYK